MSPVSAENLFNTRPIEDTVHSQMYNTQITDTHQLD